MYASHQQMPSAASAQLRHSAVGHTMSLYDPYGHAHAQSQVQQCPPLQHRPDLDYSGYYATSHPNQQQQQHLHHQHHHQQPTQSVSSSSERHLHEARAHLDRLFSALSASVAPSGGSSLMHHQPVAYPPTQHHQQQQAATASAFDYQHAQAQAHHRVAQYALQPDLLHTPPNSTGFTSSVIGHPATAGAWASSGQGLGLQPAFQQQHQLPQYHHHQVSNVAWQPAIIPPQLHLSHMASHVQQPHHVVDVMDTASSRAQFEYLPTPASSQDQLNNLVSVALDPPSVQQQQREEAIQVEVNPELSAVLPSRSVSMSTYPTFYEDDHPSFGRPPHYNHSTSERRSQSVDKVAAAARHSWHDVVNDTVEPAPVPASEHFAQEPVALPQAKEPELIAPNASAIPPPPPIEKSAHPLSALATDLVWEAFLAAANSDSCSTASPAWSPDRSSHASGARGRSSNFDSPFAFRTPTTPLSGRSSAKSISPCVRKLDRSRGSPGGVEAPPANVFGAIGGERKPRAMHGYSPGSDSSSAPSSVPGTPSYDGHTNWNVATHQGYTPNAAQQVFGHFPGEDPHGAPYYGNGAKESAISAAHARMIQHQHQQPFWSAYGAAATTPPTALYEQIQKLLAATLLSQQVLLLALYFVARLPHTSALYPPTTSASALRSTNAPFKLLLAALVVANKHLDDNSFRNSTFASVSDITLSEINALEYSLLSGLGFDINVDTDAWLGWLRDLESQRPTQFMVNQVPVNSIIAPLIEGVLAQKREQKLSKEANRHPVTLSANIVLSPAKIAMSTIPQNYVQLPPSPCSEGSVMGDFDLDAAGPLEQRPRYSQSFAVKQNYPAMNVWSSQSYLSYPCLTAPLAA